MMKRILVILVGLAGAAGCGGGGSGRSDCSSPCPSGQYCAHTDNGDVCWGDAEPPTIASATATCTPGCKRDGELTVAAVVTDNTSMGSVTATLDADPEHPIALVRTTGDTYQATVQLADIPFPHFEGEIVATVAATDEAQNRAEKEAGRVAVTRAKWTAALKGAGDTAFPLFSPALLSDGTIVVVGSDGSVHFVKKADGAAARAVVSIGALASSTVAVGGDALWVGSTGGNLYALHHDGTPIRTCSAGDPVNGALAVSSSSDRIVASTTNGYLVVADANTLCTVVDYSVKGPPVVATAGHVIVASNDKMRSFSILSTGALREDWTTTGSVGTVQSGSVSDGSYIWTVALDGSVFRTSTAGDTSTISTVSLGSNAGVLLSDSSLIVSDSSGVLKRIRQGGAAPWTTSETLSGKPNVPLLLAADKPAMLVPTSDGKVFLVSAEDGKLIWSRKLSSTNQPLQPANIWTEPGAKTSTAYLAGDDGVLYAIIVDGALDTSAPWPKAFHDPQNTSNAGVTP